VKRCNSAQLREAAKKDFAPCCSLTAVFSTNNDILTAADVASTSCMQNAGCIVQNAACKVQKCSVQSAACKVQRAECKVQNAKCKVQSAKCKMQNAKMKDEG